MLSSETASASASAATPRKGVVAVDVFVGKRIRARRRELGMSQEKLGAAIGVTFQQVQKYENGSNRVGASRLSAIAWALDAPVQYFFPRERTDMPAEPSVLKKLLPGVLSSMRKQLDSIELALRE